MAEVKLGKEEIVAAIKGMTVSELVELIKLLEQELGVSAQAVVAQPVAPTAVPTAGAKPVVEEKTEFDVVLKEVGANKIAVIKAVREITGLGLKECKDLVEAAPKPVKERVSKEEAQVLKAKLEGAGAVVEIR